MSVDLGLILNLAAFVACWQLFPRSYNFMSVIKLRCYVSKMVLFLADLVHINMCVRVYVSFPLQFLK